MAKIDRAIKFIEDNYTMINGVRCRYDDYDIVAYIVRILKRHKAETEAMKNGK